MRRLPLIHPVEVEAEEAGQEEGEHVQLEGEGGDEEGEVGPEDPPPAYSTVLYCTVLYCILYLSSQWMFLITTSVAFSAWLTSTFTRDMLSLSEGFKGGKYQMNE